MLFDKHDLQESPPPYECYPEPSAPPLTVEEMQSQPPSYSEIVPTASALPYGKYQEPSAPPIEKVSQNDLPSYDEAVANDSPPTYTPRLQKDITPLKPRSYSLGFSERPVSYFLHRKEDNPEKKLKKATLDLLSTLDLRNNSGQMHNKHAAQTRMLLLLLSCQLIQASIAPKLNEGNRIKPSNRRFC